MANNVVSPIFLSTIPQRVESVPNGTGSAVTLGLGLTDAGIPPASAGGYIAGVVYMPSEPVYAQHTNYVSLITDGIGIAKIAQGVAITLGAPLTVVASTGEFKVATGTEYIAGRALDTSSGSGVGVNHYVRIRIA